MIKLTKQGIERMNTEKYLNEVAYIGKLKRGEFHPHAAPSITDVMGGKDSRK